MTNATILLLAMASIQEPAQVADPRPYELPEDPRAVVMSLDYQGGYAPPRRNPAPHLEVLGDGTLRVPDRSGGGKDLFGRLSERELQELLRFAIETQRILEFDEQEVREEMSRAPGHGVIVMDAADTVVVLSLPRHRGEARFNALDVHARAHPEVAALGRLDRVQRRLRTLMNVVRAGGRERAAALLKLANEHLADAYPRSAALTLEALSHVALRADGSRVVHFSRREKRDPKAAPAFTLVTVEVPREGPPRVTECSVPTRQLIQDR